MKSLISILLLSVLFAAGSACAQAQTPQFPCEDDARFAEFDFWIGEWDVHTGDGAFAGTNAIESAHRGCVLTDAGMLLTGTIHYVGNDTTLPFRGLWTLLPDGKVRQFFEQSADGGETWVSWFGGFYTRKPVD